MQQIGIQKINRTSLRDQVYTALRQSIIMLELAPEQKLNDNELATRFGVSRTPVREALKRLEDEGLVESFPGAITRIAPLYNDAARHAFPVAAALHALATRLAVPQLQEPHLNELEQANEQLITALQQQDAIAAIEADDRFHRVLVLACANPELEKALQSVMSKIRRLELAKFSSIDHTHSPEDHKRIIAACKQGDTSLAAAEMEQNWLSLTAWLQEEGQTADDSTTTTDQTSHSAQTLTKDHQHSKQESTDSL